MNVNKESLRAFALMDQQKTDFQDVVVFTKSTIEPICKNCKHWRQSKEAVNFGTCLMCEIRTCNTKIEMMHSSCGLKTYKDFGCNQFSHG